MKKKYRIVPWIFLPLDYRVMGAYLEDMARKGWMLEKVGSLTAKFRAIEPKNMKFYVDVFRHGGPFTPENTRESRVYRRKAEGLGWNFITAQRYLQFFYAEKGQNPDPIQKDEEVEFTTIKKTLLKDEAINAVISIIYLYMIMRDSFPIGYKALLSYFTLFVIFGLPLLLICSIYRSIYAFLWFFRNSSNLKKGLTMETPTLSSARRRGKIFNGLFLTIVIASIIAIITDVFIAFNLAIMAILPGLMAPCAGLLIAYLIKKKARDKREVIGYVLGGVVATVILTGIVGSMYLSRTKDTYHSEASLPEGYPILTMEDLSEVVKEGSLESREFKPGKSLAVPKYYGFWEKWRVSGKSEGMYMYYYETIHSNFADLVFNGKSEEINTVLGWRNKSLLEDEKVKELYEADRLLISPDRYVVLVQKGNKVVHLSGDVDFGDMRVIEQVLDKLF